MRIWVLQTLAYRFAQVATWFVLQIALAPNHLAFGYFMAPWPRKKDILRYLLVWRRHSESNWGYEFCRLLPIASLKSPRDLFHKSRLLLTTWPPFNFMAPWPLIQKKTSCDVFLVGGATQNRTEDMSFADSCLTTWPWRHKISYSIAIKFLINLPKNFLFNC